MAIPFITHDVARSIYGYAGTEGLPDFEELPPTIQISYIEEAEAALRAICRHINFLSTQVEESEMQIFVQSVMLALSQTLDPKVHG